LRENFMRFRGLFVLLLLIAVISALGQDTISNEMLTILNAARLEAGSPILYFNAQLQAAAQAHSDDMASAETLAHLGTNGSQFWQRIQDAGYPLTTGAENVLSRGDTNAQAAFQQWFSSEAHRLNMLNPAYLELGIAYAQSASGRYYFTMVLASRDNFVPPTVQASSLVPSSTPTATATFIPTALPATVDPLALTIAAPLPTNTIDPNQLAVVGIVTNTAFPTPTEVLPPDIRLIYDSRSFSLINVSERVLNLANLAFESASGSMAASRWNTDFLSQPLSSFTASDCVQAWGVEIDLLPKPGECRIRHGWVALDDAAIFWRDAEIFTVLNNNEAVGLCLVSDGVCDVNLSRRLEDIALVNPETIAQPFDLRLDYSSTNFALTNMAERVLDLRGLRFDSDSGSVVIEEWESQFLSQPLSSFTAGDCLQAWGITMQEQAKPLACRYRHAWILVNDNGDFWRDDFTVERNGILLARCFSDQNSCNISLSANYGIIPSQSQSSTTTNNSSSSADLRLVIQPESVALVNLSGGSVDISTLAFESESGVFAATGWLIPDLSSSLTAFPNGGCLQVWEVGGQFQAKPSDCQVRHAWVAIGAEELFWRNAGAFRVRIGGTVLTTCETEVEICDFNLP
jgi:hypothetical protein